MKTFSNLASSPNPRSTQSRELVQRSRPREQGILPRGPQTFFSKKGPHEAFWAASLRCFFFFPFHCIVCMAHFACESFSPLRALSTSQLSCSCSLKIATWYLPFLCYSRFLGFRAMAVCTSSGPEFGCGG